jgi:PAS domain S-box-containing protein
MSVPLRVLIVEDSFDDTLLIVRELLRGGFQVTSEHVQTAAAMQTALETQNWDLVISDYFLPQLDGAAALALYQQKGLDIPFIVVSGAIGEERAVEIMKAGAHDYVMKDNLERLVPTVRQELRAAQERRIRKQAEAKAAYLASLVETCDDAIIGKTLDGTVVSWNAGAERLYGYTAAEMVGRSTSVLFSRYRPQELAEIEEMLKAGQHVDAYETVRVRKDGTTVEVSVSVSPIKDASGRVIGASVLSRDITQRKQEENERLALIQELTAALTHATGARLPTVVES